MNFSGVLRHLTESRASGTVRVKRPSAHSAWDAETLDVAITIMAGEERLAAGRAYFHHVAEQPEPAAIYRFELDIAPESRKEPFRHEVILAEACVAGAVKRLAIAQDVALDIKLSGMSSTDLAVLFTAADTRDDARAAAGSGGSITTGLLEKGPSRQLKTRKPLCVVIYATGTESSLPAIYRHYSRIVSPAEITFVTARPEAFLAYAGCSLVAMPEQLAEAAPRAQFLSHLVTGMQAYFEWSLLGLANEIILPDPRSGRGFLDQLARAEQDILRPCGFRPVAAGDTGQGQELAPEFVPELCRPSLSRCNIAYGPDLASCHRKVELRADDSGFISLAAAGPADSLGLGDIPLSWLGSSRMRREITAFNAALVYDGGAGVWRGGG
jgi:hypothetical protein